MDNVKILVADSDDKGRETLSNMLKKKGYAVYHAADSDSALRIARNISPRLIIMDTNLHGSNAYKTARIIENDGVSNVVFITNKLDNLFYDRLKEMNIFVYILRPFVVEQIYQAVEFSINNIKKLNDLKVRIEHLETSLENRKKIEKAKGIVMKRLGLSEDEAYAFLRKKSMDKCVGIEKIAEAIIKSK